MPCLHPRARNSGNSIPLRHSGLRSVQKVLLAPQVGFRNTAPTFRMALRITTQLLAELDATRRRLETDASALATVRHDGDQVTHERLPDCVADEILRAALHLQLAVRLADRFNAKQREQERKSP